MMMVSGVMMIGLQSVMMTEVLSGVTTIRAQFVVMTMVL